MSAVIGATIAVLAMAWIVRMLRTLSDRLLAWTYAIILYGTYLFLAVGLCDDQAWLTILAPTPVFAVLAATHWRHVVPMRHLVRRRDEALEKMSSELQQAFEQLATEQKARNAEGTGRLCADFSWVRRADPTSGELKLAQLSTSIVMPAKAGLYHGP